MHFFARSSLYSGIKDAFDSIFRIFSAVLDDIPKEVDKVPPFSPARRWWQCANKEPAAA